MPISWWRQTIILPVEINDNFAGVEFKFKFKLKSKQPCHPLPSSPRRSSSPRILLDYLLESIVGFPTDSEVKQALTDAGVRSTLDLFTMEIDLLSQLTYKVGTEREREFEAPGCFQAQKNWSLP